jgi:hypothetical protein
MPSEAPSPHTPGVGDGEVQKIVQVGDAMVAGGRFSVVTGPGGSPTYDRSTSLPSTLAQAPSKPASIHG